MTSDKKVEAEKETVIADHIDALSEVIRNNGDHTPNAPCDTFDDIQRRLAEMGIGVS